MSDSLREVLGPGGALSRVLPGYEPRPPQLAMAARVEDALAHGRALLVEAGTGTGKTLAYLLPAARSGLKVVVSTATKTLQEQLADKDVPLLRALGVDAKVAFLKGRENYLCLLRFDRFLRNPTFAVREEAAVFDGIAAWAETTQTGDRAELKSLAAHSSRVEAAGLAARLMREGREFFDVALESSQEGRWPLLRGALQPAEAERTRLAELVRALGAAVSGSGDEELALIERRCLALGADLELFSETERRPDLIHWAESRAGHLFLHASPIDVKGLLQDKLYDRIGPVVLTSATLAVAGHLEYFAQRIGLSDDSGPLFPLESHALASPFDYASNAALYLPREMPDPQDPAFVEAVAGELRALLPITSGRAFVLFTSLRNMRAVHGLLADELPWQVLLQGDAPKGQLLQRFRETPSVLFASQSFWEGVDVPGEALSLVVIDKLPFASPGEPIVAARIDRLRAEGGDAFYGYQVPHAALALKQGLGRLIRSATDRGIVAVLDPL